jgi:hypothetical protein
MFALVSRFTQVVSAGNQEEVSMKASFPRESRAQSLIEAGLLLPLLLLITFNAANLGYVYYAYLNMAAASRHSAEYSIQGIQTVQGANLPTADQVKALLYEDLGSTSLPSAGSTPIRVCTAASGFTSGGTSSQVPNCTNYGTGGSFTSLTPDPEAPTMTLNRVDIQYQVTPLIDGAAFNLIVPTLTYHRYLYMRAMN